MAEKTRQELKNYFNAGDRPTESQFADLIDSFINRQEDAFVENLPNATTTQKGIVEQATLAEVETGTDAERFVTPAGVKRSIETFAPALAPVESINGQTGVVILETGGSMNIEEGDFTLQYNNYDAGDLAAATGINWEYGKYVKVGPLVNCKCGFTLTGVSGAVQSKAMVSLKGLPFKPRNYWGSIDSAGVQGFIYTSMGGMKDSLLSGGIDSSGRVWFFLFYTGVHEANRGGQISLDIAYHTDA